MTPPEFVTFSNLIIDDIVLSDGRSFMNTLGGAGTHALSGMRPWSERLGYVSWIGADLDQQHCEYLVSMGVDMRGLLERPGYPTPRAWQLFEPDERRIEIFRTSLDDFERNKATLGEMPADYFQARGFHIQWGTPAEQVELMLALRQANPDIRIMTEPSFANLVDGIDANLSILRLVDLYSPDRDEAFELTGSREPAQIFEYLLGVGTRLVALRMGAAGSIVGAAHGEFYRVPAVPPRELIDVTGAGNAYCGGFLVGLAFGEGPAQAAARAAASASFAIEQLGVPQFDGERLAEAERRRQWALERVTVSRSVDDVLK